MNIRCLFKISVSLLAFAGTLHAKVSYLYVGSNGGGNIQVFSFDNIDGSLQSVETEGNVARPRYLRLSPDERFLYASIDNTSVASFLIDEAKGELGLLGTEAAGGRNPTYVSVSPSGGLLVTANYFGSNISAFKVMANGELDTVSQVVALTGSGPNSGRQEAPHPHAAVFSKDGAFLFVPDLGADLIRVFAVDEGSSSPLTARDDLNVAVTAGSGPRHIVFGPSESFAYLVEELTGTLSIYSHDAGALTPVQRIDAFSLPDAGRSGADICISWDGQFLYTSNRATENNIAIFSIDQATGELTLVGHQAAGGSFPGSIMLDGMSRFLLVANRDSNEVVVFSRDEETGLLTQIGVAVSVDAPLSLAMSGFKEIGLYQNWASTHALSSADVGFADDPDADGISNLLEYAFGGDPSVPGGVELNLSPVPSVVSSSGAEYVEITFNRRKDALARGLEYAVEHSNVLAAGVWPEHNVTEIDVNSLNADFEEVTVRIEVPIDLSAAARFSKLRVTIK